MPQPPRLTLYCFVNAYMFSSGEEPLTVDVEQVAGPDANLIIYEDEDGTFDFEVPSPPTEDVVIRVTLTDANGESVTQDLVLPATGRRVVNQLLTLTDEGWR